MDTKKIYEVDKIYVIEDKKYIIVHLKEKAWEHCQHKEIGLVIGNKKYLFQYVGFGNINGTLAIRLIPLKNADISELDRQKNRRMFIEVTNYK